MRSAIERWKKSSTFGKTKDIGEMLSTLHLMIISLNENSIVSTPLNNQSSPAEVRNRTSPIIDPDRFCD